MVLGSTLGLFKNRHVGRKLLSLIDFYHICFTIISILYTAARFSIFFSGSLVVFVWMGRLVVPHLYFFIAPAKDCKCVIVVYLITDVMMLQVFNLILLEN